MLPILALITSDCGAMRLPEHQMALITSACAQSWFGIVQLTVGSCIETVSLPCCSTHDPATRSGPGPAPAAAMGGGAVPVCASYKLPCASLG